VPELSAWELVQKRDRERQERWMEESSKAKLAMRYAIIKVSSNRWGIIQYDGAGYMGDFDRQNGHFKHSFKFVEGYEKLSYSQVDLKYRELVKGSK